ncbi:probable Acetylxylan esterase 2 [Rhynchosporium agropyri]|uniref:Probable Acetylxylan esterase 2 n=1 Tax=Rhynchosporium agropyri TaxID=914238 RepID=A0A1E1LP75_9HELO|nr:probable Acetylxylan esterase 2 [Rhynchosporium agropyri]
MLVKATVLLLVAQALSSPLDIEERQSCPKIHIFGARETSAPPGYGTAGVTVNLVLKAYPGSTAEVVSYPACGGQASCGGKSYSASALEGTRTVANLVNAYNTKCPTTQIVLIGYSQGSQIIDNALCGGGDSTIGLSDKSTLFRASAIKMIKAAIFMGDPRYVAGLPYNVGTCTAGGFAARPKGFTCPVAPIIKSYCDSPDPYCCKGHDGNSHQQYGNKYGQAALTFIKSKLSA